MKNKIHLILIGSLSVIFLSLIIISSNTSNILIKTEFNNVIKINNFDNYYSYDIGSINILNKNEVLPVKVYLDSYVACFKKENQNKMKKSFLIEFRNKDIKNLNNEIFISGNNLKYLEIKAKENQKLNMNIYLDRYSIFDSINLENYKNNSLNQINISFPIYIFKIENEINSYEYKYNYCEDANFNNSIKIINLEINLNKKEIRNLIEYENKLNLPIIKN